MKSRLQLDSLGAPPLPPTQHSRTRRLGPRQRVRRLTGPRAARARTLKLGVTAVFTLVCVLGACGDPPPSNYPTQQVYVEDTTLGPGDVFEVRVFRQDDMSDTYSVSAEGTISFPLIGVVEVAGKTPAEVETALRQRLADGYLRNPQVSVLVKEYNSKKISVLGEVKKPGTLSYSEGMTVVEAVAQAGGFTDLARKNAVAITRGTGADKTRYTVPVEAIGQGTADNFFVRPGDVVFVPRRLF